MNYPANQVEYEEMFNTEPDYFGFLTSTSEGLLFLWIMKYTMNTDTITYKEIINQNHG